MQEWVENMMYLRYGKSIARFFTDLLERLKKVICSLGQQQIIFI